jgi:nucleoside-diphosphate-sugar epimerase
MAWTVVRPPLVYGPSAPGNFGRLVGLVRRGIPLPFAAVNAPRSYIGLDNLVSALERAVTHPAAANQAFLVSDGQDVGAAQLVRWIALGLGRCPRLWRVPESLLRSCAGALGRADDAARLLDPMHIDSRRFRETLHWEPHMSVEEGVRRSVAGVDAGSR